MMTARILGLVARVGFQSLWWGLYRLAIGGLGHMNADFRRNGELRYLEAWAKAVGRVPRSHPLVVFDIGANKGDFTGEVLRLLGDRELVVHCFEPNPETFEMLAERFGDEPRVRLVASALSDATGRLPLHEYRDVHGSGHASFLAETFRDIYAADARQIEVPVTTVDAYMAEAGIAKVDYAKVDVEGYEKNVFGGMTGALARGVIERIQFEFNAHNAISGLTLFQIGRMLADYDIYKLLPNGTVPVPVSGARYNARIEIFKYANYVAVRRTTAGGAA